MRGGIGRRWCRRGGRRWGGGEGERTERTSKWERWMSVDDSGRICFRIVFFRVRVRDGGRGGRTWRSG